MARPENRFLYGAGGSLVAAAAAFAAPRLGRETGADPLHFAAVGVGAFALGWALVRAYPALAPDPAMRKGIAPRAFWTLVLGVLLRGSVGSSSDPERQPFLAACAWAGVMLEAGGLAMLLYGSYLPGKPANPTAPPPPAP